VKPVSSPVAAAPIDVELKESGKGTPGAKAAKIAKGSVKVSTPTLAKAPLPSVAPEEASKSESQAAKTQAADLKKRSAALNDVLDTTSKVAEETNKNTDRLLGDSGTVTQGFNKLSDNLDNTNSGFGSFMNKLAQAPAPGAAGGGSMLHGSRVDAGKIRKREDFGKLGSVAVDTGIGFVSGKYESRGDAGTVSTGAGDYGGVSYGKWQLASKTGTADEFAKKYGHGLEGMKAGSKEFSAKWKELYKEDPEAFEKAQKDFIKETHFDPMAAKLGKMGVDVSKRGRGLQEAIWSTATAMGGNWKGIQRSLGGMDLSKASDEDIIKALYAERGKRDAGGGLAYYRKSDSRVQASMARRLENEQADVLALTQGGDAAARVLASGGKKTKGRMTETPTGGIEASKATQVSLERDKVQMAAATQGSKPVAVPMSPAGADRGGSAGMKPPHGISDPDLQLVGYGLLGGEI
jgi:hypothetical protein